MKSALQATVLAGALTSIAWWAFAADNKFQVNVDMVQLTATITNGAGAYVRNLTKDDFRVYENGVEQNIRAVTTPAQPDSRTNVIVLIDTSNQMYETFAYLEDAVADFIRNLAPADSIALFSFSRNTVRLAPLSSDRHAVLSGLRNAVLGDQTELYNAMLLALRDAERMDGNKVLVVFSGGPDRGSMLTADDIRNVAEDDGVPVYFVSANIRNKADSAVLGSLAETTGGRTYFAPDWRKQKIAFESIDHDLNNSYRISYYPDANSEPGYRKIELRVVSDKAHALRIRTRGGYQVSRTDSTPP